ncbi:hypothetical protein S245_051192, partial [Arachis hypogaea]
IGQQNMDTEARDGHGKGTMSVEIRDRASIGIQEPQERRCNSLALDRHRSGKVMAETDRPRDASMAQESHDLILHQRSWSGR